MVGATVKLCSSSKLNKSIVSLSEIDKTLLTSYHWPGNVRELQNLIERAVIVSQNGIIKWKSIIPTSLNDDTQIDTHPLAEKIFTSKELIKLEKENILKALKLSKWKISGKNGAAELLMLPATTLVSKMKALGIERPV